MVVITHPLEQYRTEFKGKFREAAENAFDHLARESHVDIAANRALCAQINELQTNASHVCKQLSRSRWLCALLWIIVAGAAIYIFACKPEVVIIVGLAVVALGCLILLFSKIHPTIKQQKEQRDYLYDLVNQHKSEAWKQMDPLNRLYDWDTLYRLFNETMPGIVFDDFVGTTRMSQLQAHGFCSYHGVDASTTAVHSGTIQGKPLPLISRAPIYLGNKDLHRFQNHPPDHLRARLRRQV